MKDYLVIDLETQNSFDDVGGRAYPHLLKISVAGVYSYKKDKFFMIEEKDMGELEKMIKDSALVIGFNTKYFDYAVLQPYLKEVDLKKVPSCDIMEDAANVLGHRLSLNAIATTTLGVKKSGHGLDAIKYFREGRMNELKSYCQDDVRITRDLFDYGRKYEKLFYNEKGSDEKLSFPVYWEDYDYDFNRKTIINENNLSDKSSNEPEKETIISQEDTQNRNYSLF